MRSRKLRIAWSAICAIACLLLIVLWVRSYWCYDQVVVRRPQLDLDSFYGAITVYHNNEDSPGKRQWRIITYDTEVLRETGLLSFRNLYYFRFAPVLVAPYWLPVLFVATIAAMPWLPWWFKRFSLRTLLIATTLVAVVMGLIVWAAK